MSDHKDDPNLQILKKTPPLPRHLLHATSVLMIGPSATPTPSLGSPPPFAVATPCDPSHVALASPCLSPRPRHSLPRLRPSLLPHPGPRPHHRPPPRPCPRCCNPCSSFTPMPAPTPSAPCPRLWHGHDKEEWWWRVEHGCSGSHRQRGRAVRA